MGGEQRVLPETVHHLLPPQQELSMGNRPRRTNCIPIFQGVVCLTGKMTVTEPPPLALAKLSEGMPSLGWMIRSMI